MKFLLIAINAKYIHSNPAVYSLKAYAAENGEQVEIAEYTINQPAEEILADIYRRNPDAAGFSCYIWNRREIVEIAMSLHQVMPELPIWAGGPEVSFGAQAFLGKYPFFTGIILGEGEETFSDLLRYYLKQEGVSVKGISVSEERLSDICGLALPTGNTPPRGLTDLNKLPFLYGSLEQFKNKIIYYESSRGCPFQCSYCLSSIDKSIRFRDAEIVERELSLFLENKVRQVKFVDRTFNCNHEHAIKIWQYIRDNDNGITNFHFEIAADLLNEEELLLLGTMRKGAIQMEIGVQSTNPKTLKAINRIMDMNKLEANVKHIGKAGNIHRHLDLIAGLPYEDYQSFRQSFNRVYRMKPEQLQLGFLKVLKGSLMEERAEEYGISYISIPPYEVLYSKWISYGELLRLKQVEEMVELYYNSNQFTHSISVLCAEFTDPFSMYEALAQYYADKGYFFNSPSRMYRYEILLEFAVAVNPEQEELYRELLTMDIYLRENSKSRPVFAGDLSPYKEQIRNWYREEAENRRYLKDYAGYDAKQLAKMTHLEPFFYNVCSREKGIAEQKRKEPVYILFDYRKRDPLTREAAVCLPDIKEIK